MSRLVRAAFVLLLLAGEARSARAVEGFACRHTSQCSNRELCVADSPTATWGICRRITVLP